MFNANNYVLSVVKESKIEQKPSGYVVAIGRLYFGMENLALWTRSEITGSATFFKDNANR